MIDYSAGNCGFSMVEPRGIEPLTSTMPLNEPVYFPPFLLEQVEHMTETSAEQDQFSVPVGPSAPELSEEEFLRCRQYDPSGVDAKYTYFMRREDCGEIKIGMSNDPNRRANDLQGEFGCEIVVLARLRGGDCERHYHKRFVEHRLHGEWFSPSPAILNEIERLTNG